MLETNKLFPNSYHRIIFSKVLTYIIANIRKRTPKHYRLKRAQNVNPVSPIHLTNKTHEILFCKATLTMQIFTWYQYVWNSWNPFTFRLKPNWEQPNYPRETRRQVASHKTQKRILTRYLQSIRSLKFLHHCKCSLILGSHCNCCQNFVKTCCCKAEVGCAYFFSQKNIFHIRRKRYRLVLSARRGHWWHIVLFPESSFQAKWCFTLEICAGMKTSVYNTVSSQMLWKLRRNGGLIFKVVLEC